MVFMKKAVNNHSFLSFIFFISLVVFSGLGIGCVICAPLFALGRFWPWAYRCGAFCLQKTVRYLIVSPSFNIKTDFHFPLGACLTVSNHRSTLDAFILLSRVPAIRLIAKETLFFIPFLGTVMHLMGHIAVKKKDVDFYWKAIQNAGFALEKGAHVHIFPETGRCEQGFEGTHRFRLAPFKLAIDKLVPIIPLVFFNTDVAWPRGLFKINPKVKVRVKSLEAIYPNDYSSAEVLMKEVQQRINSALQAEKEGFA